jgi:GNAT superfamily N-acetyltransferase
MIRSAVLTDKERVVLLLKNSREGAGFDRPDGLSGFVFPYDPAYAERLFIHHISSETAVCLIHDVGGVAQGALMAVAFEHPYGPVWLSKDTMWWIDPAHRGGSTAPRMLDAYEQWAAGKGCKYAGVAGMGEDPNIDRLMRRRGYKPAELHYLKAL